MILLCNQLCQKVNDHILLRTIQAQNIRLLHIALPLIGIRLVIVSPTSPASPPWQKTAPDSGSTTGSVVRLSLSDCSKPGGLLWEGGSCGATGRCLNPDWEHRHSIPHQLPGVVDELCHKTRSCRNQSTPMIEGRRPNARTQNYNYSIATSTNPWIYQHACLPPLDHQSC